MKHLVLDSRDASKMLLKLFKASCVQTEEAVVSGKSLMIECKISECN